MALLGVDEILGYAVRIERQGEQFYRQWADNTEDQHQKKLFNFLADEEKNHEKTFMRLLEELKAAGFKPQGTVDKAYLEHLEMYAREFFQPEPLAREMKEVTDISSALQFALQQEAFSVLFYTDLKGYVPREHVELMQQVIEEEQKHIDKLEALRDKLLRHGLL
jgi:rubrerythrin